ncbi:MAG: MarR family transcriptional regulator [Pseudomonadota bacterium]
MFDLIRSMNLIVKPFIENHAKSYDLTLPEWRAMMILASAPGANGEEIARRLTTDRMSVSRALRRMEEAGRTRRRKSEQDRKNNEWFLTEEGWSVFDEIAAAARQHEADILLAFSDADRRRLATLVKRLMERAEQIS